MRRGFNQTLRCAGAPGCSGEIRPVAEFSTNRKVKCLPADWVSLNDPRSGCLMLNVPWNRRQPAFQPRLQAAGMLIGL